VPVPAVDDPLLGAVIDPLLGGAMLHFSAPDRTAIYYPERQDPEPAARSRIRMLPITIEARPRLEALLGAMLGLSDSLPPGGPAGGLGFHVVLADHEQMPERLHPVGPVRILPGRITAWVCEKHVDAGLARWLGALCAAQADALRLTPTGPPAGMPDSSMASQG
jgi:hypothetical protein